MISSDEKYVVLSEIDINYLTAFITELLIKSEITSMKSIRYIGGYEIYERLKQISNSDSNTEN